MRKKISTKRGRLSGEYSRADIRLLEYLTWISTEHRIDLGKFFEKLVNAWKHQESRCKDLTIKCRKGTNYNNVFLITNGSKVIAQFPIPEHILTKTNLPKEFIEESLERNSVKEAKVHCVQIKNLRAGMRRIAMKARVLEISPPRLVVTNFGSHANVANALVCDKTGTIQLPLWNKQIDEISVGDLIQVENANIILFKGERQVRVNRSGKLSVIKNS